MSRVSEQQIDEIKESNDIVDVISSYIPLTQKGGNHWARCPFHNEKTASFSVSRTKQIYHCFGCGVGGNVINFIMEYEKISFPEALKMLAERAGIDLQMEKIDPKEQSDTTQLREINEKAAMLFKKMLGTSQGKIARDYLEKRQISADTADHFNLGYAPEEWDWLVRKLSADYDRQLLQKSGLFTDSRDGRLLDRFRGRLMFPIQDERGNFVGFGGRILHDDKKEAKYLNSPETPIYNKRKVLYGLNHATAHIRQVKKVIVVEGYMDYLQLYQHGYNYIVAGSGTAFTPEQAKLLRRFSDQVLLCYDSDTAGRNAAVKAAFRFSAFKLDTSVIFIPEGDDPDSFLLNHGSEAFHRLEAKPMKFMDFLREHYKLSELDAVERSKILETLIEYIRDIPDPVYRELFARDIANIFHIDENTFLTKLNRRAGFKQADQAYSSASEKGKKFRSRGEAAEFLLLQLYLNDNAKIRAAGSHFLSPALFSNEILRETLKICQPVIRGNPGIKSGD